MKVSITGLVMGIEEKEDKNKELKKTALVYQQGESVLTRVRLNGKIPEVGKESVFVGRVIAWATKNGSVSTMLMAE